MYLIPKMVLRRSYILLDLYDFPSCSLGVAMIFLNVSTNDDNDYP